MGCFIPQNMKIFLYLYTSCGVDIAVYNHFAKLRDYLKSNPCFIVFSMEIDVVSMSVCF